MNIILGFLACTIAIACAMTTPHQHITTHRPHPHLTHAPPIGDGFTFRYDRNSHRMAVVNNHKCWVYHLTDDEQRQITDTHFLRSLEMKLIQLVDYTPDGTPMSHSDLALMSKILSHMCRADWPIVALN
ncbi:uncharacterized protein [Argopecten irradians]|uniref:uncharacterized protein n=1 Tax=Argopecten irradians TaxID=31199 RepID=UPI00371664C2